MKKLTSGSVGSLVVLSLALGGCDASDNEFAKKLGTVAETGSFTTTIQKRGRFYGFYLVAVGCEYSRDETADRKCFPRSASIEITDLGGVVVMRRDITAEDFLLTGWHAPRAAAVLAWRSTPEEATRFEETALNPADQALENGKRYTFRLQTAAWPTSARGKGYEVYERYHARPWYSWR